MPLVSDSLPNLLNGISQQPASLRLRTQGEVQDNAYSSLVEGLKKRAPAEHIARLTVDDLSGAFVHKIDRDTTERFETFFSTDFGVRVFDLSGVEQTVNVADFTFTHLFKSTTPGTTTPQQHFLPAGVTTIQVKTVGLLAGDSVQWQKSSTGLFEGEQVGLVTHSNDADTTEDWTSGDFLRMIYTRVSAGNLTATVTYKSIDYLKGASSNTMRALTVADFTFVVNNTIKAALSNVPDAAQTPTGLIFIKQAVQDKKYEVFIDGASAASTTPADAAATDTSAIAAALTAALIVSLGGSYSFIRKSNVIKVERLSKAEFTMRVEDGFGGKASVGVKDTIQKFTDLPNKGFDGFVVQVIGDETTEFDNFYVKYNDEGESQTGVWEETVATGLVNSFDANTMPHTLVREADGTFTFGAADWAKRVAGDAKTAPEASFIGRKINAVLFTENRLGFLADENFITSEFGEFFNFWPTTVTALLATDRIDISGGSSKVSILRHAVPHNEQLVVFSEETQFVLDSGDVLSPRTAKLKPTTAFRTSARVTPVGSGKNIYFVNELGAFTRVREYFVSSEVNTKDAADITSHVPSYIPKNVRKITGATHDDVLFFLSEDEPEKVFIYKFFWGGKDGVDKLQSSWSRWLFDAGDNILNVDVIDENLIMTIQRADGVYLEKVNLQPQLKDAGLGFQVLLDRRVSLTGTYDAGTDITTWTLPYADTGLFSVVLGNGFADAGDAPAVQHPTSTTVTAPGDFSAAAAIVGRRYGFRYDFSELIVRESTGSGEVAIKGGTLKPRNMLVVFENTGFFIATVTPKFRQSFVYKFTGNVIGQAIIGDVNIVDGTFRIPIQAKSDEVTISLTNDTHLPCAFLSAEWEGWFSLRARRV